MSEIIVDSIGRSGKKYRYWFLERTTAADIKDEGGNYVFVKRLPNGNCVPLYFGVADSLRNRIPNHEKWSEAIPLGCIGVMTHTTPAGDAVRRAEEQDLIAYWNPALNVQHRTAL